MPKTTRIGILIDSVEDRCEYEICQGILNYFSAISVQVIIIEGVHNFRKKERNEQYISTSNMVNKSNLNGLIVFSSFFLDNVDKSELIEFISSFINIPIVSVGENIPGIPSVLINEDKSLIQLVDYLVLEKKLTRFNFMFESNEHENSNRRLKTILNRFRHYEIYVNNKQIRCFEYVNHKKTKLETQALLKESLVLPEAIICFDDYIALGVIDYLESRNISVPNNILVTGFDDISTNSPFLSKLITIKQPFFKVGVESAKLIAHLIENDHVQHQILIDCSDVIHKNMTDNYMNNIIKQNKTITVDQIDDNRNEINKIIMSIIDVSEDSKRLVQRVCQLLCVNFLFF